MYCTPKILNGKSIQKAIGVSNDDYMEVLGDRKARPIISDPESPTEPLIRPVENLLKPVFPCLITYVKDDWAFYDFCQIS